MQDLSRIQYRVWCSQAQQELKFAVTASVSFSLKTMLMEDLGIVLPYVTAKRAVEMEECVNKRDIVILLDGIEGSMFGCARGAN